MKIEESDIWIEFQRLSPTKRDHAFDTFSNKIEEMLDCKLVDRNYGDLGDIKNPCMAVHDTIRNIYYLKEFVPNQLETKEK